MRTISIEEFWEAIKKTYNELGFCVFAVRKDDPVQPKIGDIVEKVSLMTNIDDAKSATPQPMRIVRKGTLEEFTRQEHLMAYYLDTELAKGDRDTEDFGFFIAMTD